jgi:hypothetical protein
VLAADAVPAGIVESAGAAAVVWVEPDDDELRAAFRGADEEHPDAISTQAATEQVVSGK